MEDLIEIDLLKHSSYDKEILIANKKFLNMLIDKITDTYEAIVDENYNCGDSTIINLKTKGRIATLFFKVNGKGMISFKTRVLSFKTNYSELMGNKEKYNVTNYSSNDYDITISNITKDNFNSYLGDIVRLIEVNGFNLRR